MNSRRLARLMGIICDIKAHPRRTPEEMCKRLGISRRQFYKDRDSLSEMGFAFHYSRTKPGFVLDKELTFNVQGVSLADLFALILAVRELTGLDDFSLAMGALAGLRNMAQQLPENIREEFLDALDQVVVADGFACRPAVLHELMRSIRESQRVVLVLNGDRGEEHLSVGPKRLFLREGSLFLEASGLGDDDTGVVAVSRIGKVLALPLFSSS